jgi:hypothetical protein
MEHARLGSACFEPRAARNMVKIGDFFDVAVIFAVAGTWMAGPSRAEFHLIGK